MQQVKNKKLTYILICAVAAVWGIVLYKVFFKENEEEIFPVTHILKMDREPYDLYIQKPDTFHLALNYRDPFLGKVLLTEKSGKSPEIKVKAIPPLVAAPPLNWGQIQYSGRMVNPLNKKVVSILYVNGKEKMMTEGEVFDGVKLLKNKGDSVLLSWQGKQKHIKQ